MKQYDYYEAIKADVIKWLMDHPQDLDGIEDAENDMQEFLSNPGEANEYITNVNGRYGAETCKPWVLENIADFGRAAFDYCIDKTEIATYLSEEEYCVMDCIIRQYYVDACICQLADEVFDALGEKRKYADEEKKTTELRYIIFKEDELIGTAFKRNEVAEIVKGHQQQEAFKNKLNGEKKHSRFWALPVSESMVCIGANGEFNDRWAESDKPGWGYLNEND